MADGRGTHSEGAAALEGGKDGEKRVALVIGNGAYRHTTQLHNPTNDACAVATKLAALGFDVVGGAQDGVDLDYGGMAARMRDFGRKLRDGVDTALLFFAGHGLQVQGRNYLVPVDAALEVESDVGSELFELQFLLNQMERPNRTSIVMLDACRNNPLAQNLARAMGLDDARSAGINEGLAEQRVVAGTLIAYATQPGHVAYDGDGSHGFFTEALLEHIERPALDVELMLRDVRGRVIAATQTKRQGPQVPWVHSSLLGAFYFLPAVQKPGEIETEHPSLASRDADDKLWARIEGSDRVADYEFYLEHFPKGRHAPLAHYEIEQFVAAEAAADTVPFSLPQIEDTSQPASDSGSKETALADDAFATVEAERIAQMAAGQPGSKAVAPTPILVDRQGTESVPDIPPSTPLGSWPPKRLDPVGPISLTNHSSDQKKFSQTPRTSKDWHLGELKRRNTARRLHSAQTRRSEWLTAIIIGIVTLTIIVSIFVPSTTTNTPTKNKVEENSQPTNSKEKSNLQ